MKALAWQRRSEHRGSQPPIFAGFGRTAATGEGRLRAFAFSGDVEPMAKKPAARKALSKSTRFEVFKRDGFVCQYCGAHPPSVVLEVDHLIAVAAGGGNDIDNLITACNPCNRGKGARALNVAPMKVAEKAAIMREKEDQLLGYQALVEGRRARLETEAWRVLSALYGRKVEKFNASRFRSILLFIDRLGLFSVLDAAETTASKPWLSDPFIYLCGMCWRMIRAADDGEQTCQTA